MDTDMAASTAIFILRVGFMSSSFAVRDHPVQIVWFIKDHISSTVVVINALFVEEGIIGRFNTKNLVDVGIAPTGIFIGIVEIFVSRAGSSSPVG